MGKVARDETLQKLVKGVDAIATALSGSSKTVLDETFAAMIDGSNTTEVFHHWWRLAREQDGEADRYETLCRWFEMMAEAWEGKYYTLRIAHYSGNSGHAMTPMGELAGKSAAMCATENSENTAEWCDEDPMTWYVRFNGLSLADGTMNVLAVEGVDGGFDKSGNTAPVYTGRMGLFKRHYTDGTYEYKTFTSRPEGGFAPWAGDVDPADNSHRPMNWEATYGGSLTSGGKLTSGSGYAGSGWERNSNTPAWRRSAAQGLTDARKWNAYEGTYSDTDLEPILDLFQMRHFDTENSGIIEGCLSYNFQYAVAAAEEGVTRVLLTTAQAANLLPGSCVEIGSNTNANTDRNNATMYDIVGCATILSIETVTVGGNTYAAVNLDLDSSVDIPTGAYISTMPWVPGSTDHLPGRKDGSLHSCTDGKAPARIAGVEIIDGAYAVGLDPLWQSDYNAGRTPQSIYTIYQVRNSEHQASSVTANHVASGTFESAATGWQYIKHLEIRTDGMIAPDALGGSSNTYMKSAFYFYASSGVRCPWRFLNLGGGGVGGLAGAYGHYTPSSAHWGERPRLSGSGKKRGEWAA